MGENIKVENVQPKEGETSRESAEKIPGHTAAFQQVNILAGPLDRQTAVAPDTKESLGSGAGSLDVPVPHLPTSDRPLSASPTRDRTATGTTSDGTTPEKVTPPKGQDAGARTTPAGSETRTVNAPVAAGDATVPAKAQAAPGEQPRLNQPLPHATDVAPVKTPGEVKTAVDTPITKPVADVPAGTRTNTVATDQATPQIKPTGAGVADPVRADVTAPRTEAASPRTEATGPKTDVAGAKTDIPGQKVDPVVTHTAPVSKPDLAAASTTKVDGPVGGAQPIKANSDAPGTAFTATGTGQKQESIAKPVSAEASPILPGGQVRPDGVKGDYISTQAISNTPGRQDTTKGVETNPAQAKLNEPAALKDQKLGGAAEAGGQRSDAGLRSEPGGLQPGGVKQDSKNPDSMIRSIEGKVDGAKQPSVTEGRVPGAENVNTGVKQPGTTDSATGGRQAGIEGGAKQPGTADGIGTKPTAGADGSTSGRPPGQEIGGKTSGGGSGTVSGESTKRIDIGSPSGGRSEGQPGGAGMGGGSSAPIDRAPHKPFGVEDAHGTGNKGTAAGQTGAGPRFDTGETRGTELGQRFDTPELRGGKSGGQSGGAGSDLGGVKGTDVGIGKGADGMGGKGGAGGGTGFSGSGESSMLGDKRQPPIIPDGVVTQTGKGGKGVEGLISGPSGDDSAPFILPGALGGKDGGRRQSDQIFADKTKGETPTAKPDAQRPDASTAQKFGGQKPDSGAGSGVPGQKDGDKGHKSDVGIPAAIPAGGAADVGGVLRNFAQNVLTDGKDKVGSKTGDTSGAKGADSTNVKTGQDFAGPGQKTRFLDAEQKNPGDQFVANRAVGPGGAGVSSDKKPFASGEVAIPGMDGGEEARLEEEAISMEAFDLPQVDLLGKTEEVEEVSEEVEKTTEATLEEQMHYELALGLQLYTSIAQAPYGAYHYHTKDGDTVETVARDIVGDVRTAPLVFSLNKEHIIASTEYGTHPFKAGVMIQLPTPRDLKEFFGKQQ